MASDTPIIHDPNGHSLTPGNLGTLCSDRMVASEAYRQPEAYPEYWMGSLLRYASQEYFNRDPYEFGNEIFDFIRRLSNGHVFIAAYEYHGILWDINRDSWPSFSIFSPKDRLRIMRRAVRLLWEECWEDWLWSLDPEKQSQASEDSQWAALQGIPPIHTTYERQRTTALRSILCHPYQAAEQIVEAAQRRYEYWRRKTKEKAT